MISASLAQIYRQTETRSSVYSDFSIAEWFNSSQWADVRYTSWTIMYRDWKKSHLLTLPEKERRWKKHGRSLKRSQKSFQIAISAELPYRKGMPFRETQGNTIDLWNSTTIRGKKPRPASNWHTVSRFPNLFDFAPSLSLVSISIASPTQFFLSHLDVCANRQLEKVARRLDAMIWDWRRFPCTKKLSANALREQKHIGEKTLYSEPVDGWLPPVAIARVCVKEQRDGRTCPLCSVTSHDEQD